MTFIKEGDSTSMRIENIEILSRHLIPGDAQGNLNHVVETL